MWSMCENDSSIRIWRANALSSSAPIYDKQLAICFMANQNRCRSYIAAESFIHYPLLRHECNSRGIISSLNHRTMNAIAPYAKVKNIFQSEVRDPAIVTPIYPSTPPQRLVLRSSCFTGLWVSLSLEFRQNSSSHIRMQLFTIAPCLYLRIDVLDFLFRRGFCSWFGMRGLVYLRP